ncbi:YcgJ family protein [Pseudomonas paeninsulae]|uniref:YcgJ family protein n=1 Tax=Pseudomonas paeninsulae TaxID=3110772 RepID=UPI002D778460|nr:YcgJ family protein [Pseudomonas sp. IT1137]
MQVGAVECKHGRLQMQVATVNLIQRMLRKPVTKVKTMNKPCFSFFLTLLLAVSAIPTHAGQRAPLRSPEPGVLCDRYLCVNDKGVSRKLTEKYLSKKAATKLFSQGDFDLTEFTFANRIFCDVKERLCREDRYYGANGERSGAVSRKYTELLFGQ